MTREQSRTIAIIAGLLAAGCMGNERVVLVDRMELSTDGATVLDFDVGPGSLDLVGEEGLDAVHLEVELRTNRTVLAEDDAARENLQVVLEEDGERAVARVLFERGPVGYWADVILRVPARLAVTGRDDSGDASIADVASLDLVDDSGELEIVRVPGPVRVEDGSGGLILTDVGPTTVIDGSGTLRVTRVVGALDITDDDGDLWIEDVDGDVTLEQGSGDVRCLRIDGDVEVTDDSGSLWFEDVTGRVTVDDGSGDIDAVNVGSLEVVADSSGEVDVR